ncbi:MAG: DUF484 family protein [Rhodospirillales bacterium]|nr:DUF484 family protein [Rhodospirillales bacterium]
MNSQGSNQAAAHGLTEDEVAVFLRSNPEFLNNNAHILGEMSVPGRWNEDGIVDFQKVVTEKMRGEIDHLKAITADLLITGRSNQSIQERTHQAILALVEARSLAHMAKIIADDLPKILDLDIVALCLEPSSAPVPDLHSPDIVELNEGDVDNCLGAETDIILSNDQRSNAIMFGVSAEFTRSAAIVRLNGGHLSPAGLLALGSKSHSTFHPEQGTELLTFLARVIEKRIHGWLEPQAV